MLDRLLDFLSGRAKPEALNAQDQSQLAVAALLVEAARMDRQFDDAERATIEHLIAVKFSLSDAATRQLIEAAEHAVQHSTQLFPFTNEISKRLSPEARVHLIEMLWKVAYADGALDPHEDMLVRRVAGLIHVSDRDRANARKLALDELKARKGA